MLGYFIRCCSMGLLVGVVAWGCASTGTLEVEVYDPLPSQPFAKFLVVGIHENGRIRRLFENAFIAELAGRGVEGVQSYRFIYEERAISVPNVLRAVQESGADAVITVRVLEADRQPKRQQPVQRETFSIDLNPESTAPTLLPRRDKFTLQTNVYQAADRHLVLSAMSRVVGPDSVETIGEEVCRETVESLSREHLLRR